jgi:hypothetical protein
MRTSVDPQKGVARSSSALSIGCLLLLMLAGCSRDLSLPPLPAPTSAKVRVTVTILRSDPVTVSVRGQQKLDENGLPASGAVPEDSKTVQPVALGQSRTAEFDFPVDSTIITAGTWDFIIGLKSIVPGGGTENAWQTTCTTNLRKDGLNSLDAIENVATCTGDFAVFSGQHEVGIGEVQVERIGGPAVLRVGDKANIKFIAINSGESTESFSVTVQSFDPSGHSVASWTANVSDLPSGSEQVVPTPNDAPITWDTSHLPPGDYIVQAGLTAPLPGDPQPTNDRNSTIVQLAPGDLDGDGIFDDVDNCPTVPNPNQENCEGGTLGDACNTPKIRAFEPSCNIAGGATVTVIGFGFANTQPTDIMIGPAHAANVTSSSACKLEFTNPQSNANPAGVLRIATTPAVQMPLCCATPTISAFTPAQGKPKTPVTVLGCGFTGVAVSIVNVINGSLPIPIAIANTSTAQELDFAIPPTAPAGAYVIVLTGAGFAPIHSQSTFLVTPP